MKIFCLVLVSFLGQIGGELFAKQPNVCPTPFQYMLYPFGQRGCKYNPDVVAFLPDLVQNHGFNMEEILIETDDGYILNLMHLFDPKNKTIPTKGTILFLHPSLASGAIWVDKGVNESIGLRAFDAGYDVYLGNFRGSTYSRRHVTLNPDTDTEMFWNFTYHEMGTKDIPAMIKRIRERNGGEKITLIGHSMGGSATMIYTSINVNAAKSYIKRAILLAPAVYLTHVLTPLAAPAAFLAPEIYTSLDIFHHQEVFAIDSPILVFLRYLFARFFPARIICDLLLAVFFGPDLGQILYEPHFPILLGQNPAGISLKTLNHYAQSVRSRGTFREYDYGKKKNRELYGNSSPPDYPVEKIQVPMYIMYGSLDFLVTTKDSIRLFNRLPKSSQLGLRELKGYNHVHFAYGKNIEKDIVEPVLTILNS